MKPIIALVPDGAPGYSPGADYQLVDCPRCGRRCWIGPVSFTSVVSDLAIALCSVCAVSVARDRSLAMGGSGTVKFAGILNPHSRAAMNVEELNRGVDAMTDSQFEQLGRDERTSPVNES